jgi:hypothetical protein
MQVLASKYWKDQATNLLYMAQLLSRKIPAICLDVGPMQSAGNRCLANIKKGRYSYYMDRLSFKVSSSGHIPSDAPSNVEIFLSVRASSLREVKVYDPFSLLEFNIEIEAHGNVTKHLGAWHLDRHITSDEETDALDVHPLYHFHFGGNAIKQIQNDVGRILVLEGPRIAHPPMDVLLGIDFILSHFAGGAWRHLKEDTTYKSYLKPSQDFLFKNYISSLHSHFGTTATRTAGMATALWPNLLEY